MVVITLIKLYHINSDIKYGIQLKYFEGENERKIGKNKGSWT